MNTRTKATGWPVYALAGGLAFLVAGCSSDDDGGSQGTFNDGPVANLDFEVDGTMGKTGADGSFPYGSPSDQITFSVGDIVLGTGTVKSFMTPVDLVPGAIDENDDTVTNIARFLQTLDADQNLSNGIQIPDGAAEAAAGLSLNFAQTPEAFESDPNVQMVLSALTSNALVSAENARAELRNTILVQLAGSYGGSFTGDASGCWSFLVGDQGAVTGTFDIESSAFTGQQTLPLMGTIPSSGAFTLTASMPPFMLTISGTASTDGDVNGSWTLTSEGAPVASGMFTGGKDQPCQPVDDGEGCPDDARFVFTPFDDSGSFTVCTSAGFDCQGPIGGGCVLQVFDLPGSGTFVQFGTTEEPFMVNANICFGFDFAIGSPNLSGFGDLTGRQFGDLSSMTPFASGQYTEGIGGEPLGTFQFYEDGFMGFQFPTRACDF